MTRILTAALLLIAAISATAQRVDTLDVPSAAMHRDVRVLTIVPAGYDGTKAYPVVYLLHGHGGHAGTWLGIRPDLPEVADRLGMLIVCPDGRNSWYYDSPADSTVRYETFMTGELPQYIDANYTTVAGPEGRAVTGLSMGGHGGLWLGFRHPDVYGNCGSTSGGVDIRPFPRNWHLPDLLGAQEADPSVWDSHTVMTQLGRIRPGQGIIFDCGTSDFFLDVNERLHKELTYRNIPHEYTTRPGAHKADYWQVSVEPQLMYFSRRFKAAQEQANQ